MNIGKQNLTSTLPHLALSIGDPAGIGPEIVLKALADPTLQESCQITVIGSRFLLEKTYHQLKQNSPFLIDPAQLLIFDPQLDSTIEKKICFGEGNAASGEASFVYLDTAISHTLANKFQGIVTAPIAKVFWKAAGYNYPGQTEVLAQRCGVAGGYAPF
jgi:4-hydroxythreonine-4-phosphate dehydrogenase